MAGDVRTLIGLANTEFLNAFRSGDATAMAKDVRAALVTAYADVKALSPDAAELAVTELERSRRYHQDVY